MCKKGFEFINELKHQVMFKKSTDEGSRRDLKELSFVHSVMWNLRSVEGEIEYVLKRPRLPSLEDIARIKNMKFGLKEKEKFYDQLMELDVHEESRSGIWNIYKSYAEDIKKWGVSE